MTQAVARITIAPVRRATPAAVIDFAAARRAAILRNLWDGYNPDGSAR